ncbi:MAG: hypothetical protein PVH11_04055 [Anaerolineae bacterium]|jgi:hypothetical protein
MKDEKKMDVHLDNKGQAVARAHAVVSVSVPTQKGPRLAVKGNPFTTLDDLVGGEFAPRRPVLHLRLEEADEPGTEATHFDPPITLRVRYTAKDVHDAGDEGPVLGYWDGSQWIKFKEKHQFRLEPHERGASGGFGVAVVSDWVDPPLAWG